MIEKTCSINPNHIEKILGTLVKNAMHAEWKTDDQGIKTAQSCRKSKKTQTTHFNFDICFNNYSREQENVGGQTAPLYCEFFPNCQS